MNKKLTHMINILTVGMLIFSGLAVMASYSPNAILPHERYGNAKIDGTIASDGQNITSWIYGANYGSNLTYNGDGSFDIITDGDDETDTTTKWGGVDGDDITYRIDIGGDTYIANENDTFISGGIDESNLTFSSTGQPTNTLKINEIVTQPGDGGSQYVYLYNESTLDLSRWKLSTHGGWEATLQDLTTQGAFNNLYVDLGTTSLLDTSSGHLMLSWDPGTTGINNGSWAVMDRVEYGNQDTQPENTTLVDYPGAPGNDEGLIRSPNGTDTNDCEADFTTGPATPRPYSYGVDVIAPSDKTEILTGNYTYNFTVNNTGTVEDTYNLSVTSSNLDWNASVQDTLTVGAGGSKEVPVNVTIPDNATEGDQSEIDLKAVSENQTNLMAASTQGTVLPHERYGQAIIDGGLAADGQNVTSWIHGVSYGSNLTYNGDGSFGVITEGDDETDLTTKYGGVDGDEITYRIDTSSGVYIANENDTFTPGGIVDRNLTFSSTDQPTNTLKINEIVTQPGDGGSQYVYLYNESTLDLSRWKLSTHGGWEATLQDLTTQGAFNNLYVDLGTTSLLDTSSGHLMLSWDPGTTGINNGSWVVMDRVEYGDQDTQPENTTLVDYPGAPGNDEGLIRSPNGTDTNDCENDFTTGPATPRPYSYGVDVIAPSDDTVFDSGNYTYNYTVTNMGDTEDTYNLTASSSNLNWTVSVQKNVTVQAGDSKQVPVEIKVPDNVTDGNSSAIDLKAVSQADETINDTDSMTVTYSTATGDSDSMIVTYQPNLDVNVTAPPDQTEMARGTYTYNFTVENQGNVADTYDLNVDSSNTSWTATGPDQVSLAAGENTSVQIDVTIPVDADNGSFSDINLTATSQNATTSVNDSDEMRVTYNEYILTILNPDFGTIYVNGTEVTG
ncbi:MAG: hypothetical protein KGY76_05555, partial [Candidatus Thermoplasmatota archaeon]|nr:hypothetical protein [Candidatus Thermoplasmatota archaeon]